MAGPIRVTGPLLDVLDTFLEAFDEHVELHGWAIMRATKRSGPTVYGILDRLEDAGWVTGRWEDHNPEPNKPRRRFYRLTPDGVTAAHDLIKERRPQALRRHSRRAPRPGVTTMPQEIMRGGAR
jgi:PadR family transcriptional regulator